MVRAQPESDRRGEYQRAPARPPEISRAGLSAKTPDNEDREIGQRLRQLRKERRISQRGLGDALGVTFQQVQKYEQGTNRLTGSRVRRAADHLGVPLSYFYGTSEAGDATRLMDLFQSITDERKRQAILSLIESMA